MEQDIELVTTGAERIGGTGPVTPERELPYVVSLASPRKPSGRPPQEADVRKETPEETARRHATIRAFGMQAWKEHEDLVKNPAWKVIPYTGDEGITAFELPPRIDAGADNQTVYTLKASGIVEGKTATEIARLHLDTNKSSRLRWDKELSDIGLVERISGDGSLSSGINIQYAVVTPPALSMLYPREFVNVQVVMRHTPDKPNAPDTKWTIVSRHIDHPLRPPTKEMVRALSFSAMIMVPLRPKHVEGSVMSIPVTQVTIVGWMNPGGVLPASIVTHYKTALADRIKLLRNMPPIF